MRFAPILLAPVLFLTALPGLARANELFQSAPIDQVSIRTLPDFTVVETEATSSLDAAWAKGYRLGARYAALSHSHLNTPTILTFPDWEKSPSAEGGGVHVIVQIMLDPLPNLPKVHDRDAALGQIPAMTVACYALRGAYSPASFVLGLKKIEEHLKAQGIPVVGPPRYLYYTNTDWVPSWWRISEVQVPIAAGGGRN